MARPRKHNKHLPRGMIFRHGAYYYVRKGRYIRLDAEYGPALTKYADLVGERPQVTTVAEAIAHYIESAARRLAPATLEGYRYSSSRLAPVFGHMALDALKPSDVYRYLTAHGNVAANRDRALLSAAYTHARRIGAFSGDDPAKGLQYRNTENPRQRYVTDEEFERLLAMASDKMACILRFAYLTGMRQGDILRVRVEDITEQGIRYRPGKAGVRAREKLIEWTPELRAVVDDANRLWRRFGREWLFESRPRGKKAARGLGPYTPSGLRSLFRLLREKAGLGDVRLHDLRRKAGSDVDEKHAQELLAHADGRVTRRHYRAKADRIKPVR